MLQNRWLMLAVIFASRTTMGLMYQSIAAVGPLLIEDLRLSYSEFGMLLGLFMLPGAVIALPGGVLGQRFGGKRIATSGLALMLLGGLVTAESHGFAVAATGRIVAGTGGVLLNVALAKMVADWFAGREISTAMAVMLTSFPVGMALAVALLGHLATAATWRTAVHASTAAAALGLVLVQLLYRHPSADRGAAPGSSVVRLSWRDVSLSAAGGLAWGLYNAGFFVLGSFAPAFLVSRGASVAEAGVVVSAAIGVSLVSVPLGGYVADRLGRPNLVIIAGCVITAIAMALTPVFGHPAAWFVMIGFAFGLPAGALMSLLPGALAGDRLATGLGLYYTVFYLAIAGALPITGIAQDLSAIPSAPVMCAAVATGASALAVGLFRLIERQRAREVLAGVD